MSTKTLTVALPGTLLFVVCAATAFSASDEVRRSLNSAPSATKEPQVRNGGLGARLAVAGTEGALAPDAPAALPQQDCSDSIKNCKLPVKYTGSQGDCACFACEYGKPAQHYVCTKNKSDKDKLMKQAQAPGKR